MIGCLVTRGRGIKAERGRMPVREVGHPLASFLGGLCQRDAQRCRTPLPRMNVRVERHMYVLAQQGSRGSPDFRT